MYNRKLEQAGARAVLVHSARNTVSCQMLIYLAIHFKSWKEANVSADVPFRWSILAEAWTNISCTIHEMRTNKLYSTTTSSSVVVEFAHLVNLASSDNLVLNTWMIYIGPACTFIWTTYYHTYVLSFPLSMRNTSLVLQGDS
jgi:hypothetical protein